MGRAEKRQVLPHVTPITGQPFCKIPRFGEDDYGKPTVFLSNNTMRVFREKNFGPVVSVCNF